MLEIFMRCRFHFDNIRTFRRISLAGPAAASGAIYEEWYQYPYPDFAVDTLGPIFEGLDPRSDEVRQALSKTKTQEALTSAQSFVDAASLVFAHSVLDDIASECCRISVLAGPDDWLPAVDKRKVTIEQVRQLGYEKLKTDLLKRYIEQLAREPLMKRLDNINQRCQPVPVFKPRGHEYKYDRDRIRLLDDLRHDIIHRIEIRPFSTMTEDLDFLEKSSWFLIWMVNRHYNMNEALTQLFG